MNNIYMQNIMDHYHDPENYGELEGANAYAEEHNPLCGDKLEIFMIIEDEKIVDVMFKGEGCAISQASMSMLSSEIKGMNVKKAQQISKEDLLKLLGIELSPTRLKCALLSLDVLRKGLQ